MLHSLDADAPHVGHAVGEMILCQGGRAGGQYADACTFAVHDPQEGELYKAGKQDRHPYLGRNALLKAGHQVVAADMIQRDLGLTGDYTFKKLDVTRPEMLKGLCDGADAVISTVGLTKTSATLTNYDIDYQGNLNLLNETRVMLRKSMDLLRDQRELFEP